MRLHAKAAKPPVHAGEYEYAYEEVEGVEAIGGMQARCPCGCGAEAFVDFGKGVADGFDWDGVEAAPTVRQKIKFPNCKRAVWYKLIAGAWSE